ncbi:MAG TPA: hypothetical protein VK772_06545 [Puia sp.]|jgi:hypothetical protein|nr:hypothetical protein [Puia sp.]
MKKNLRENIYRKSVKTILPIVLMSLSFITYAGKSLPIPNVMMVTKTLNNKKHKVRLFTASDNKTLLFTVNGVEGKQYKLFVFDLEGKLIMQSSILNRETGILPEISAGNYLYEVFVEDTEVENGQLKIK